MHASGAREPRFSAANAATSSARPNTTLTTTTATWQHAFPTAPSAASVYTDGVSAPEFARYDDLGIRRGSVFPPRLRTLSTHAPRLPARRPRVWKACGTNLRRRLRRAFTRAWKRLTTPLHKSRAVEGEGAVLDDFVIVEWDSPSHTSAG
ncbi:hypothetical protein BV20DRAFT_36326 [Pilatotrama ljubarskyi]|nr:hypothetical protein BV20DRAFT_36326 [Pilatotrama ljubarskyi]